MTRKNSKGQSKGRGKHLSGAELAASIRLQARVQHPPCRNEQNEATVKAHMDKIMPIHRRQVSENWQEGRTFHLLADREENWIKTAWQ